LIIITRKHLPNTIMDTQKENKNYITPYAFGVSDDLIGKPLASPRKRLFGLILDLIMVALLTSMSVKVLAVCVFVVSTIGYFRAKKRDQNSIAPTALVVVAVVSAFIFLSSLGIDSVSNSAPPTEVSEASKSVDKDASKVGSSVIEWAKAILNDLGLGLRANNRKNDVRDQGCQNRC